MWTELNQNSLTNNLVPLQDEGSGKSAHSQQ